MKCWCYLSSKEVYLTSQRPIYSIHGWLVQGDSIQVPRAEAKRLPVEPGIALEVNVKLEAVLVAETV